MQQPCLAKPFQRSLVQAIYLHEQPATTYLHIYGIQVIRHNQFTFGY